LGVIPAQEHEISFGDDIMKMLLKNGIAVGDRGLLVISYFENLLGMILFYYLY